VLAACGGERPPRPDDQLPVVATTMPLQDFTRRVGGDRVEVTGLLGPGAEPHEYEPTPSDAEALRRAGVVVANGAGLDDWLGDLLDQAGGSARRVEATTGIRLQPTAAAGGAADPHVWHDPRRAKRMVDNVAAGLAAADPPGRSTYEANARAYRAELEAMARAIRRELAPVPPPRRTLVTSHDAFGYFARAYGVDVVGSVFPATTGEAEPSAREVRRLVEEMRRRRVSTIFAEAGGEPTLERRIAAEAGARVSSSLYADSLGPPGSGAEAFVGAELANARAMRRAWSAR
jgi:zinc/manganese transport system substrate-binding protein